MVSGVLVVLAVVLAGCGRSSGSDEDLAERSVRVVTTTSIIADLARVVGGDRVDVTGLMGPGVDPHLYKASEGDVSKMARADVIFYNGLDLEGKMTDVFAQMRQRGQPTYAVADESVPDSLLIGSPEYAGNFDPHVWLDAELWMRAARYVADRLGRLDTAHAAGYERRAEAYVDSLRQLDTYVTERAQEVPVPRRVLITSHDAFSYFGRAYDFEVRGLQGISTASEAGTADVQNLAAFVAERRIPAMFVETSVPERGIEAVQAAVQAQGFQVQIGGTLYGDALGGPETQADTYVGMVRSNIDTIVGGLTQPVAARD
jgi:manganese/zinc/iron transport system substrate-binding protein